MKRLTPLFLLVFGFLSCQNSPTNKIDLNQISEIDLSSPKDFEILKIDNFNGMPEKGGILKSYHVKFPEFEKAIYFGSDGKGRSGIIPSNRGYMWILDNKFNLISNPIIRDKAGTFGNLPTKEGTYTVLKLTNGKYLALLPLVGEYSIGYFKYLPNKLPELSVASFGTAMVNGELPVIAYAIGDNIYDASQKVWNKVIESDLKGVTAKIRSEKTYPEYWNYLGWCSWEEYRYKISEDLIAESMQKINKSEVPIRWVLIDEGPQWYQDPEGKGRNRFKLGLYSFDTDPEKFPNGLTPLLKYKSEDKIKWMGIWQHQGGLYRGIAPNNIMGEEYNKHFEKLPNDMLMPKSDFDSQYKFFEGLFSYTKNAGLDFVKVDFQGPHFNSYADSDNAVFAHTQSYRALEAICKDNNWGLINCFAHDMSWALNSSHSTVTRASQDYRKGKPSAARIQTYQCYNNKLWMGHTVWGDHDMFHSNDAQADRMMAVSKAVAGAPIYVSDAPEDFVPKVINPLCYEDGELIRPLAPATALPESFFLDPLYAKNMYRVIAPLANGAASIVCYNIYDGNDNANNDVILKGVIKADDYKHASALIQPYPGEWVLPEEGLVAFDAYNKKLYNLSKKDIEVELTGLEDLLFHICPVKNGWAVIGLTDKHLAPATVIGLSFLKNQVSFQVKQAGELALYVANGTPEANGLKFRKNSDGLWFVKIPNDMINREIIISAK